MNDASPSRPAMYAQERPVIFRGIIAATSEECPAHCSAPPLHASYRLPRLTRDVEAVTRPRAPLHPLKREESSTGAEAGFEINPFDEVVVKVEAAEPEATAEAPRLCARMSAVRIHPEPTATDRPRKPGRPKGSKSRPRVERNFVTSAPPEREKAEEARAKWTPKK